MSREEYIKKLRSELMTCAVALGTATLNWNRLAKQRPDLDTKQMQDIIKIMEGTQLYIEACGALCREEPEDPPMMMYQ